MSLKDDDSVVSLGTDLCLCCQKPDDVRCFGGAPMHLIRRLWAIAHNYDVRKSARNNEDVFGQVPVRHELRHNSGERVIYSVKQPQFYLTSLQIAHGLVAHECDIVPIENGQISPQMPHCPHW